MESTKHDKAELTRLQALPLSEKVQISLARISEWYRYFNGNVYVGYSGGKDSTVLLHLVRRLYPDVPALFCNTGLEYPEIQKMAKETENTTIIRPKIVFTDVVKQYGYPLISKEVSEAIYYARRMGDGGGATPPRKRQELHGEREHCRPSTSEQNWLGTGRVRPELLSEEPQRTAWDAESLHRPTVCTATPWGSMGGAEALTKRSELHGEHQTKTRNLVKEALSERRAMLLGSLQRQSGGVFSNGAEIRKSAFNKEKWLPLCQLPIPISHYCCNVMKKQPSHKYAHETKRKAFIGTLAEESRIRQQAWMKQGCNAFNKADASSQPLSFWTEQDILQYIVDNGLKIASVYGNIEKNEKGKLETTGVSRTGCIYCLYGMHLEKGETRFQKLSKTHPKQYDYCMKGGQWIANPAYMPDAPEYDGKWKNWNPKEIWVPSEEGLGMKVMFDMVNEVYGKDFYRYE